MKTKNSYKTGVLAEFIACVFLTLKFYRIIKLRYKSFSGEIDIIALKGKTLVFVEVKKRASENVLFDSITNKQKQRIINAAHIYLSRNKAFASYNKRFDAIFIRNNFVPKHIKSAWIQEK